MSRLGLASGYGVPAAAIEKAFLEYGVDYLVLARPLFRTFRPERYVENWLKKLGLEWIDLPFQDVRKPMSPQLTDQVQRLQNSGKVRFLGMSSHDRPLFGKIARGEVEAAVMGYH